MVAKKCRQRSNFLDQIGKHVQVQIQPDTRPVSTWPGNRHFSICIYLYLTSTAVFATSAAMRERCC